MSLFDSILSQVGSNVDVANMAAKLGISPEQAEQAIGALAQAHPQPGDTVETAAQSTGLDAGVLQQIVGHIGGEGSLGQFAQMIQGGEAGGLLGKLGGMLDRDGDGSPLNDIAGMASSFFGKKD